MRYLKVTAQDRTGNGRADSVLLEFYEQVGRPGEDRLMNKAFAVDFDADGKVDYKMGDVTQNGKENSTDQRLLYRFANHYLKLHWFNRGAASSRYLKVIAEDFHDDGAPNVVRLQLHEGRGMASERTLNAWHAAFDSNNDGEIDASVQGDVNHDGLIDKADEKLVRVLAATYLKFRWY